jgi:hypothetical protein
MILNQEDLIKKIEKSLTILEVSTRNRTRLNLNDQNVMAEPVIAKLLNLIYGYNLVNLNIGKKNSAAIDLGDKRNKIAVQVTSTNTRRKIQDTINKLVVGQIR